MSAGRRKNALYSLNGEIPLRDEIGYPVTLVVFNDKKEKEKRIEETEKDGKKEKFRTNISF